MLTRLRKVIQPALSTLGISFSKINPSPNFWTAIGLVFSLLAGYLFYTGYGAYAGISVLVSGFMDVVDGSVARATGKVSRKGGFIDSNLDRLGESVIYLSLLLYGFSTTEPVFFVLVSSLALTFSLLVSYSRSRAEAAGIKAEGVGYGERAERLIILSISSISGLLFYGLVIVVALAVITYAQRLYVYSLRLDQSERV